MIRALVVEDEVYARKNIVKIINSSELDIHVCADVESAEEAIVSLAENQNIQLVLSDIQMGSMDGLELSRYLYENYPRMYVVLITAHERFDYAREALKYNVKDYIIKPVFRNNLLEPLHKMISKIEDDTKANEDFMLRVEDNIYKQYITMKSLAKDTGLQKQIIPEFLEKKAAAYRVLLIQSENRKEVENIYKLLKERLIFCSVTGFFSKINNEYIYILLWDSKAKANTVDEIAAQINQLINYIFVCHNQGITAGMSRLYCDRENLYKAYNESIYATNQRLIDGWNKLYVFTKVLEKKEISEVQWVHKLSKTLAVKDYTKGMECIHNILAEIVNSGSSVQSLYKVVINLLKILSDNSREAVEETNDDSRLSFSRRYDLYRFNRISDLEAWIEETILYSCCTPESNACSSTVIKDIVEYVKRNYYRDICLRELAESKYFMSYSYLSRLFSKKMGRSFSKYLIDYRLEKSKVLLKDKNLLIGQVSFEVGYRDVSHYIHSFKKAFGMTPEEYRATLMKEV